MKRSEMLLLGVFGFLIIICCFFLNMDSAEWMIEVSELPNVVRENPITVQEGVKAPRILRQLEMRVAAFQIRNPRGEFIFDQVARKWQQEGLIKGYSTGLKGKDLYFLFNGKRIEFWTDADKCFAVEGEIILLLLNDDGEIIADAVEVIRIDYRPPSLNEVF